MQTPHDIAAVITSRVTVSDIIGRYLPAEPIRAGRIRCPFHGGKNQNLGFNSRVYHCFVCGARGDAIGFVRQLFELSFYEAAKKIDEDFGVGLHLGERQTIRQMHENARKTHEVQSMHGMQEALQQSAQAEYDRLLDEWIRLDDARRKYAPQTPFEPLDARYVEAVLQSDKIDAALNAAQEQLWRLKRG